MRVMNNVSCIHLQTYKNCRVSEFRKIYSIFIACISEDARKAKASVSTCFTCKTRIRLHACLFCVFVGCYNEKHIHEHAHGKKHYLAADILYGNIYCFCCSDYKYDSELDEIAIKCRGKGAKALGLSEPYVPWLPSYLERNLLVKDIVVSRMRDNSYLGFRGLVNLGNTCYMNCIIQVLVHTPILREYFLSDQHTKCQNVPDCIICEISSVFQELYSGKVDPFKPSKLLKIIWINDKFLATCHQHDAHEFFFSILNIMNKQLTRGKAEVDDVSIIERTFQGQTQSDLVNCQNCKIKSSKTELFLDFGLSFDEFNEGDNSNGGQADLRTDIEKFIAKHTTNQLVHSYPETICEICKNNKLSYQHITFHKLPIVLCFHLKRFSTRDKNKKISMRVSFPEIIDMTSYLCYHKSEFVNSGIITNDRSNRYCLFAVVCHIGPDLGGGHYIAYVRQRKNLWFKCDDHLITEVDIKTVLATEAYILFYHKQLLEYE